MGNSYFQFKQFTIQQARATLKVCTESCIFGAYIPAQDAQHILDIGTGTGLLSLMLAQRSSAQIQAIEIDQPSFEDAQENFKSSLWNDHLEVELKNIKEYAAQTQHAYDLIICNPPFFIQQLKSPHARTNTALHGLELKPSDLYEIVDKLTKLEGRFYVLLPETEMKALVDQFTHQDWTLIDFLSIHQKEDKPVFRTIAGFQKTSTNHALTEKRLIIKQDDDSYSEEFCKLLKEYYLHL
jgi:tRNA1Val (adenine37-N6)-methyltransferase